MELLLPTLAVPVFAVIGLGAYLPYKHGAGTRRHLGAIPVGLALLGLVVGPFLLGLATGVSNAVRGDGRPVPAAVALALVHVPLALAFVAGAINVRTFRSTSPR
jgi:hypothetical protein